jgi:radical SAM protein with 4Fe4S-binding SPASM domain
MENKDSMLKIIATNGKYFLLDCSTQLYWVLESNKVLEELANKIQSYSSLIELLSQNSDKYSKKFKERLIQLRRFSFFSSKGERNQNSIFNDELDINQLYINPSTDCNLDCWFCYADISRLKEHPKLRYEDIKEILTKVLDYKQKIDSSNSLGISIGFTEEINLNFELFLEVSKLVEQLKTKYSFPLFLFSPSTNLIEISKEFIDFMNKYKFLTVSIDISNESQISEVIRNITKFNDDVKKHLIIPFHSQSKDLIDIYSRFSPYFDNISLRPVRVRKDSKYPWSLETIEEVKLEISNLYKELIQMDDEELLSYLKKVGPVDYFIRYIERVIGRLKLSERCPAGKTAFSINSSCEITPCSSLLYHEDLTIEISNWNIEKAVKTLRQRVPNYSNSECSICFISSYCGGPCMDWVAKQEDSNLNNPSSLECYLNRHITEESLVFVSELIIYRRNLFERIVKERKIRNRLNYSISFNEFSDFFN